MATIRSLSDAIGTLQRNPTVFAVGLLYAVIVLPQQALETFGIPIFPTLLQILTFFVTPFVIAGLLGMVYEGLHRETSFDTFTTVGKGRYLAMLAGNLIEFVITFFFIVVGFFVVVFTVGFGLAAAGGVGSDLSGSVISGIGLLTFAIFGAIGLLFFLVMFFVQFYSAAIVVDTAGPLTAFANSISVVRQNLVASVGFGLINFTIGVALFLPTAVLLLVPFLVGGATAETSVAQLTEGDAFFASSLLSQLGIVGYSFLVSIVMVPFRNAFAVAFYDEHRA